MCDSYTRDENEEKQKDEIAAISSIYGEDFEEENREEGTFIIHFRTPSASVDLKLTLPKSYPTDSPPVYEIHAPWMDRSTKQELHDALQGIYLENIGEPVIFLWAKKIRDILPTISAEVTEDTILSAPTAQEKPCVVEPQFPGECPQIFHGETVVDRKSVFQAHVANIKSSSQVQVVRDTLMQNKKIANATHNIVAYRFENDTGMVVQDCDDDGETAAGSRLLHLLNILHVTDVIVVVSRWYGGILLGPDRFKHINNVARAALKDHGFLQSKS